MDVLVEKARTKIGNAIFLLGKYPEKIMYHQPWLATDGDVLQHLTKNGINFNMEHARQLSKDIIKVYLIFLNKLFNEV